LFTILFRTFAPPLAVVVVSHSHHHSTVAISHSFGELDRDANSHTSFRNQALTSFVLDFASLDFCDNRVSISFQFLNRLANSFTTVAPFLSKSIVSLVHGTYFSRASICSSDRFSRNFIILLGFSLFWVNCLPGHLGSLYSQSNILYSLCISAAALFHCRILFAIPVSERYCSKALNKLYHIDFILFGWLSDVSSFMTSLILLILSSEIFHFSTASLYISTISLIFGLTISS
jgi:hypothetical protein